MFVLYSNKTHKMFNGSAYYKTERIAKSIRTRNNLDVNEWVISPVAEYDANMPTVTVKSLMSGAEVQIKADQLGTCNDPSTERYWTM